MSGDTMIEAPLPPPKRTRAEWGMTIFHALTFGTILNAAWILSAIQVLALPGAWWILGIVSIALQCIGACIGIWVDRIYFFFNVYRTLDRSGRNHRLRDRLPTLTAQEAEKYLTRLVAIGGGGKIVLPIVAVLAVLAHFLLTVFDASYLPIGPFHSIWIFALELLAIPVLLWPAYRVSSADPDLYDVLSGAITYASPVMLDSILNRFGVDQLNQQVAVTAHEWWDYDDYHCRSEMQVMGVALFVQLSRAGLCNDMHQTFKRRILCNISEENKLEILKQVLAITPQQTSDREMVLASISNTDAVRKLLLEDSAKRPYTAQRKREIQALIKAMMSKPGEDAFIVCHLGKVFDAWGANARDILDALDDAQKIRLLCHPHYYSFPLVAALLEGVLLSPQADPAHLVQALSQYHIKPGKICFMTPFKLAGQVKGDLTPLFTYVLECLSDAEKCALLEEIAKLSPKTHSDQQNQMIQQLVDSIADPNLLTTAPCLNALISSLPSDSPVMLFDRLIEKVRDEKKIGQCIRALAAHRPCPKLIRYCAGTQAENFLGMAPEVQREVIIALALSCQADRNPASQQVACWLFEAAQQQNPELLGCLWQDVKLQPNKREALFTLLAMRNDHDQVLLSGFRECALADKQKFQTLARLIQQTTLCINEAFLQAVFWRGHASIRPRDNHVFLVTSWEAGWGLQLAKEYHFLGARFDTLFKFLLNRYRPELQCIVYNDKVWQHCLPQYIVMIWQVLQPRVLERDNRSEEQWILQCIQHADANAPDRLIALDQILQSASLSTTLNALMTILYPNNSFNDRNWVTQFETASEDTALYELWTTLIKRYTYQDIQKKLLEMPGSMQVQGMRITEADIINEINKLLFPYQAHSSVSLHYTVAMIARRTAVSMPLDGMDQIVKRFMDALRFQVYRATNDFPHPGAPLHIPTLFRMAEKISPQHAKQTMLTCMEIVNKELQQRVAERAKNRLPHLLRLATGFLACCPSERPFTFTVDQQYMTRPMLLSPHVGQEAYGIATHMPEGLPQGVVKIITEYYVECFDEKSVPDFLERNAKFEALIKDLGEYIAAQNESNTIGPALLASLSTLYELHYDLRAFIPKMNDVIKQYVTDPKHDDEKLEGILRGCAELLLHSCDTETRAWVEVPKKAAQAKVQLMPVLATSSVRLIPPPSTEAATQPVVTPVPTVDALTP